MKIAVIGNGKVGLAVFRELQEIRGVTEVVLVGRNAKKLEGEIEDYRDAAVLRDYPSPRFSFGGYEMTEGCDILIYTAGSSKVSSDRMEMLRDNCAIAEEIFEQVNRYNRDGIVICITNPLDVITTVIRKAANRDRKKVIGTGTLLDSARLARYIADLVELSPDSVNIDVVGEHGNSSVPLLSSCRICGKTLEEYFADEVGGGQISAERIARVVREAGFKIFAGKGHTSYGVACAACRIVSAIIRDSRQMLPVSVVLEGEYGLDGIAISTPCVIGREGVAAVKEASMTENERQLFYKSAKVIQNAVDSIG
ncbi:MAG: hypothetical protein IJ788_03875 [Oscillospiraceae bacterium]|nr:hypothetical protein [Oscillospiraceae bacterium]